jgi:hypothetical protein
MKLADILAANGGSLPRLAGGSEKTEAEAGAKTTAEGLIKVETEARKAAVIAAEAKILAAAEVKAALLKEQAEEQLEAEEDNEALAEENAAILSLGLRFRGAHNAAVTYLPGDVATEAGKAYLCTAESEGKTLITEELSNWFLRGLV